MPSVSWSRDIRRQEEQEAKHNADVEASFENVSAMIKSWTSDRVGNMPTISRYDSPLDSFRGGRGSTNEITAWMNDQSNGVAMGDGEDYEILDDIDTPGAASNQTPPHYPTTPMTRGHQSRLSSSGALERADTPVMSNSKRGASDDEDDEKAANNVVMNRYSTLRKKKSIHFEDKTPSPNIHTPAVSRSMARTSYRTPTPFQSRRVPWTASPQQLSLEDRNEVRTCQRYHDVLLQFRRAKRSWVERSELASQSTAIVQVEPSEKRHNTSTMWSEENTRNQVEFLSNLATICYEEHHLVASNKASVDENSISNNPCREGNFWNMLAHLRGLGMDALLWPESSASNHVSELELIMQKHTAETTPLEKLQSLRTPNRDGSTSLMERRYELLSWLEDCFYKQLPFPVKTLEKNDLGNINVDYKENSELHATQGLPETTKDAVLLRQSLSLVLAGRLSHALDLMRFNGLSWRAAVWGGGTPFGYEDVVDQNSVDGSKTRATGNPNRALWQSMMWRLVEESKRATHEERAVTSLLCNNVKSSFDNPVLRSWEKALYVGLKAIVGRTEDVVLYRQSTDKFAAAHIKATSDMADMDEASLVNTLMSTPYQVMMQANDLYVTMTAGFLIGQTAVKVLLDDMEKNIQLSSGYDSTVMLRFVTHLLLYLDSTMDDVESASVAASIRWELQQIRDRMVVEYMKSLAEREIWNLVVLYSSFLPTELMLEHLPPLLVPVTNINDQRTIVKQLHEIQNDIALHVLRVTVEQLQVRRAPQQKVEESQEETTQDTMIIEEGVDSEGEYTGVLMNALSWLCIHQDHAQEALVYSNSLIRRFLLRGQLEAVFDFVEHIRPTNLLANVEKLDADEDQRMLDEEERKELDYAIAEHCMYEAYLVAERAVTSWFQCMEEALDSATAPRSPSFMKNMEEWNEVERSIALTAERRQLIKEKRELASRVVEAAHSAREALLDVLTYQGGWLWDEEPTSVPNSREGDMQGKSGFGYRKSHGEWEALRKQVLPHVAMLHGQVCQETAEWMSESLLQGFLSDLASLYPEPSAENTFLTALMLLDPSVEGEERIPLSSSPLSPIFWTTQGMELNDILASDAYNIPVHEQAVAEMAKLTVAHLQYSANLDQNPSL